MNIQSMTKRDKILEFTTQLIAEEGVNGSPMSQIAKKAGIAVGTFYHHFKSKEEIINEIYISIKKNFGFILEKSKEKELGYKEEFEDVWLGVYNFFVNNPVQFKFLQQIDHCPIITNAVKEECEKYLYPIFEFYQKGIDNEDLIDMDVSLISSLTYSNIITTVDIQINRNEVSENNLKQAIDYSWRAIAKK
jgi:AcrR family transcriptional regulator